METNSENKSEPVKVDAAPVEGTAVNEVKDTSSQPAESKPAAETKTEQPVPSNPAPKAETPAPAQSKPQPRANPEPKPDKQKVLIAAVEAMLEKYKVGHVVKSTNDFKYPGMKEVAIALADLKKG